MFTLESIDYRHAKVYIIVFGICALSSNFFLVASLITKYGAIRLLEVIKISRFGTASTWSLNSRRSQSSVGSPSDAFVSETTSEGRGDLLVS